MIPNALKTLEAALVVIADVVGGAVSAVDPHTLPMKYVAIGIAVQHAALAFSRDARTVAEHLPSVTSFVSQVLADTVPEDVPAAGDPQAA